MVGKHWNNINALVAAKSTSTEDIISKTETTKQNHQESLEKQGIKIKPPSLNEMEELINGNLSLDDFKSQLVNNNDDDEANNPNQPENDTSSTTVDDNTEIKTDSKVSTSTPIQNESNEPVKEDNTSEQKESALTPSEDAPQPEVPKTTAQELISTALEELYSYEAELLSQLGEMKREAVAKINSGNGTKEQLISIGMEGLDKCYELEVSADAKVKGVLDKLKSNLEDIGADSSITKELWEYYCDEKENTKTYYLNKYL